MSDNRFGGTGILALVGCVALFFLTRRFFPGLANLLLIVGGILLALIVLLVVLVIYFSRKGNEKIADGSDISVHAEGRAHLMELRRLTVRIKDKEIQSICNDICKSLERILRTVKEKKSTGSSVRKFQNYYLPTIRKIVQKYAEIEESGIPAESTKASTVECLKTAHIALQELYEGIFDGDKLDLSVEMDVLTVMCKRDGLLTDEDFAEDKAEGTALEG